MNDSYIGEVHWAITCIDFGENKYAVECPVSVLGDPEQTGYSKVYEGTLVECCDWIKYIATLGDEIGEEEEIE